MARPLPSPPEPEDAAIPDWHLRIVEERLAAHKAHPEQVVTWEEAEAEILSELRRRSASR